MVNGISSSMSSLLRPDPKDFFNRVDTDGSGGISQAELQTMADKLKEKTGKTLEVSDSSFASYDTDGDGSLSADELKSVLDNSGFGPPLGSQETADSSTSTQQLALDAYDSNAAGSTSSTDSSLSALLEKLQTLLAKLQEQSDQTDAASSVTGGTPQPPPDFFNKVDSDGSGGVSQDELQSLASDIEQKTGQTLDVSDDAFASYDTNGDGSLSADELKSAMEKNGFKGPQGPPPPRQMDASAQDQSSTGTTASLQDQIAQLSSLIQNLSSYATTTGATASSLLSITT